MEKTAMQYHIDRLEHYRYLIENPNLGMSVSPEYLINKVITSAESLLEYEKEQAINFAHRAVNKWAMFEISKETVGKLYEEPKKKVKAIQFTGTIESANSIVKFTEGFASYSMTADVLKTGLVPRITLGCDKKYISAFLEKEDYILIGTNINHYEVISKKEFESSYELEEDVLYSKDTDC